ncbi:hypothetical protein [Longitalea luteola]|uniref:hypothetical protein n=1 Tax=Longitalea luteola TaxID=2812563 RepID=UPI001A95ABA2|nr:hypothetical protein [Longitalea luteola]
MDHKIGQLRQPEASAENRLWLDHMVTTLQQRVSATGIDRDVRYVVENNIQKNPERFTLALETETGRDKLGLKLHFIKEGSDYNFPGYEATLFHHTFIAHRQINGIDTRNLDNRMKQADWHYGIAESDEKVIKGYKNAEAIKADLRQLAQDGQGKIVAAQLWNNHVPANTVTKPDFY